MRNLMCLGLLWCATPVFGQSANTLTPKEVAEGWLLLFDGDTDFGWKGDGAIKVADGTLEIKGGKETVARAPGQFQDFELHFEYREVGKTPEAFVVFLSDRKSEAFKLKSSTAWTTYHQSQTSGNGSAQLAWTVPEGSTLSLKNIKIRPLGLKSIYNGTDLTGWKEFPGKKSRFTITPDGAINIKDGPGDLQTEGKYDDFVLQLECISNGKHLNSGVFFRCRPNEYQNGYEAQIRNQFTAEPTQDYTLEDYDPQTHKLIGKKKAKFTAVDFGTGAIYRRQPARKEVAKDGAWFTFTVLAHKNHLLTWVDGIQVADWTDNRPPSDNARTGCRLEAGHISLQGHDPTTDLSFRNFRIGTLK